MFLRDGIPAGSLLITALTSFAIIVASYFLLTFLARRNPLIQLHRDLILVVLIGSACFGGYRIFGMQSMRGFDQGRHHNQSKLVAKLIESGDPELLEFAVPGNRGFQFVNGIIYSIFGECPNVLSQIYGFMGIAGVLLLWDLFYRAFEPEYSNSMVFFALMVIGLPSIVFWSQGLMKEGPALFGYCLIFQFCPVGPNRQIGSWPLGILGTLLAVCMRPHMAICYLVALGLILLSSRANFLATMSVGLLVFMGFIGLQSLAPEIFVEPDLLVERLSDNYSVRAGADKGSTITGEPIPILSGLNRIFLRPYPTEAVNFSMVIASLEICMLTGLMVWGWLTRRSARLWKEPIVLMALISILFLAFPFSFMYNLGLLSRQRVAAIPAILVVLLAPWLFRRWQTEFDFLDSTYDP